MTMLGVEVYNLAIQQLAWGDAAAVATVLFILISGADAASPPRRAKAASAR